LLCGFSVPIKGQLTTEFGRTAAAGLRDEHS